MKKTKVIIKQLEDLKDHCSEMARSSDNAAWEKDVQALNYAITAIKENIIYKDVLIKQERETNKIMVAFFGTVRNSTILEQGLKEGKSMQEINTLTIAKLNEILKGGIIDFENMRESYNQGIDGYNKIKQE